MSNQRFLLSRNKREGYYAGYYPIHPFFEGKAGHKRWPWFAMSEFYPRIWGYRPWEETQS